MLVVISVFADTLLWSVDESVLKSLAQAHHLSMVNKLNVRKLCPHSSSPAMTIVSKPEVI